LASGVPLNEYLDVLQIPDYYSTKDNKEILAYLKELKLSQEINMHRMRIMVVGPGEAGKTTLVHRILTGEFTATQFSRTDGISMNEWEWSPPMTSASSSTGATDSDGNPDADDNQNLNVRLSLWDFGGQEVYLNTHPMLFSNQTIYLLVWNPLSGTTVRQLEEYLLNIRNRAQSAPIVLVTTNSSEVGGRESERHLRDLDLKYTCVERHAIDSRTGEGIEELKSSLIRLVTQEYVSCSRVSVPHWYSIVESRMREESSRGRFSLDQAEFLSICSSVWPSNLFTESNDPNLDASRIEEESLARMKPVLDLFHQWGVIFVLPSQHQSRGGNIVLEPQQLANVFKCVITSNNETINSISNQQLFKNGILFHNQLGFVWSEYEAGLHHEFLCLLHQCDLAYEMFDWRGDPSGRSLVPALLPHPTLDLMEEEEVRGQLLSVWETGLTMERRLGNGMISRGVVKIKFDTLLSNFFPKLLVRLRVMSSEEECSRRHCVIHIAQPGVGVSVSWSVACVVEDLASNSLLVYPGGCSFDATTIVHQAIQSLMGDQFSGMCIKEVTLWAEEEIIAHRKIITSLLSNRAMPVSRNLTISLNFLSCLFAELDQTHALPSDALSTLSDLPLSQTHLQTLLSLHNRLVQYEASNDVGDKLMLSRFLIKAIPSIRQCGLMLSSHPAVLWLVGLCSNSTVHAYAVSPSVTPGAPWEVVWGCNVIFPSLVTSVAAELLDSSLRSPMCQLLLQCLRPLLPDQRLPDRSGGVGGGDPVEWIGVLDCRLEEMQMASQASVHFVMASDNVFGGEMVYYSREVLLRQRGQMSAEDMKNLVKRGVEDALLVLDSMPFDGQEQKSPQHAVLKEIRDLVEGLGTALSELKVNPEGLIAAMNKLRDELGCESEERLNELLVEIKRVMKHEE
jgi:GTPase SAR1 family protein